MIQSKNKVEKCSNTLIIVFMALYLLSGLSLGVSLLTGNFAEIKRISPPNGSHKTITKKQGVHETNEALLFFRSSVFH